MSNAFLFFSLVTRMTGQVFNWCFRLHHEQQTVQSKTVFSEFSSAFNGVSSKHDLVSFFGRSDDFVCDSKKIDYLSPSS